MVSEVQFSLVWPAPSLEEEGSSALSLQEIHLDKALAKWFTSYLTGQKATHCSE